jgi:hypothetical protein
LSINNAPLLSSSKILPRIYASQVLSDFTQDELSKAVISDTLDTAGASFGLSYGYSLRHVTNSSALVFRLNVFEAYFFPPTHVPSLQTPMTIKLDDPKQRVVELILLPRPLQSAGDSGPAWEIVTVRLADRDMKGSKRRMKTMEFLAWDEFGRKGSPSHLLSTTSNSFVSYISSGLWGVSMFILGVLVLFVVVCVVCVFGWDRWSGEYDKAQSGKGRMGKSQRGGSWVGGDVEKAKGKFLSAHELGMRGAGSVVGVGKSD